jgi:decaprenyl-phosphate phosphoribosyltransferase
LKNALVAAAPGAAGVLLHRTILGRTGLAFAAFCLVAGGMYLLNDASDVRWDRQHPRKRHRPVAAGVISVRTAVVAGCAWVAAGLGVSAVLGLAFSVVVAAYVGLTVAYTVWLKRVAVIDLAVVASGFVLRAVGGSEAAGVRISEWFLILISFGALFVVAGKRHGEATAATEAGAEDPARAEGYTIPYLRYVWMVSSAVSIAAYCLWAFAEPHVRHGVAWSEVSAVPFVLAVLRYALLLEWGHGAAPEDVLYSDRTLQVLVLLWLAVYGTGVYLGH